MPSPFPGMDPYLEDARFWQSFHHNIIDAIGESLLPGLRDRYQPSICKRRYAIEDMLAEPAASGARIEEYIEIHGPGDGPLVTLLDVVSPSNRTTAAGREAYLNTRHNARAAGASLVEIDLVMQGTPMLDFSRENLPDWDYAVTVTRATHAERHEIYTSTLRKRLPRFRLPLAAGDRDTVLDLQELFARCYDRAGLAVKIDYRQEPPVPLSDENRRWLDELLRTNEGLRLASEAAGGSTEAVCEPSLHERIALAAYFIWQQEGCPHGRDREHWDRAVKQIRGE